MITLYLRAKIKSITQKSNQCLCIQKLLFHSQSFCSQQTTFPRGPAFILWVLTHVWQKNTEVASAQLSRAQRGLSSATDRISYKDLKGHDRKVDKVTHSSWWCPFNLFSATVVRLRRWAVFLLRFLSKRWSVSGSGYENTVQQSRLCTDTGSQPYVNSDCSQFVTVAPHDTIL